MTKIKTYVTIDSVDVSSYVYEWEQTDTYGDEIPEAIVMFKWTVSSAVSLAIGSEIIIKRGPITGQEYNVFRGIIDSVSNKRPYVEVMAKNPLIDLVRKSVNTSFDSNIDPEAGIGSDIMDTLITEYGGLSTNSGATVVSTGSVIIWQKFVCRQTDIYERVKTILDVHDYQMYYNYDDDYVYLEPIGYQTNSTPLVVGGNVTGIPEWLEDATQLINKIRIDGAEAYSETTESGQIGVTTGYTVASITLLNSPFSTKVYSDAANPPTTLRIGGVVGSSTTFDYYVDEEENKVYWNTSQYTPGGADFVEVRYTYPKPIPVIRKNQVSIDAYWESYISKKFSDIKTVEDAIYRGDIYLATYSEPFLSVTLNVPEISNDYRVGQTVTVTDTYNGKDESLVINSIKKKWPHKYDEISVGDGDYKIAAYNRLTLDKIKRLEEEFTKNEDILIQIIDIDVIIPFKKRYLKIQKRTATGTDLCIFDHPVYGLVGTAKWGDTDMSAFSSQYIHQGNNTYKEFCYDTEFDGTPALEELAPVVSFPSTTAATNQINGYKIYANNSCTLKSVTKISTCTATKCYLCNVSGTILETGTFVGDIATFNTYLTSGNSYYTFCGSDGASYNRRYGWPATYPYNGTNINWTSGSDAQVTDIPGTLSDVPVNVYNILSMETLDDGYGSFDTTNEEITLATGHTWTSEAIFLGTTFNKATLTLGTLTGSVTIEISANGKGNWQTLTNGTRTTLTNADATGVYIRLTENAAATARVENTVDIYGQRTAPAVKLLMEE